MITRWAIAFAVVALLVWTGAAYGQDETTGDMGGMMSGRCPMCGGPMEGADTWNGTIPKELPKPENRKWVARLQHILVMEKYSEAQYTTDEGKFHAMMPYKMIILQERNHVEWISQLFAAYDVQSNGKVPAPRPMRSVRQAYETARNLESSLIPQYVWLEKNAEDKTTRQVLNTILLQTRMHQTMFIHALEMEGMGMM